MPCIVVTFTMMSVEPGIVDANVLVYALDTNALQHVASRILLDAGRTGATTLYVTSQVLCEFYSIVTNLRRVLKPPTAAEAIAAIADLLSFLHVLPVPARAVEGWLDLLRRRPPYTYNTSDFDGFEELPVVEP